MKRLYFISLFALAACGAEVSQTVITDPAPPGGPWGEIALTVTGPGANADKRKACMQEARNAGVRLREGAPTAAALFLSDEGNRLSFADGRPERPLGKWTARAVCRVAIAIVLRLDERVHSANGQAPQQCRMLGTVEGQNQGYAFFVVQLGSYEAALAQMQIMALRMGGNFVTVDVVRQLGLITSLNGRAFDCGGGQPNPNAPPGQQI